MTTILLVDDEPQIAQILRDYLEHAGYSVASARDGLEALRLFEARKPALIVLDLGLPGMDGVDVARTLRKDSHVPIIMLTARAEEHDRLRGLDVGADDYITKPFSPRELVARVRAVLRRSVPEENDTELRRGDLLIDRSRMTLHRGRIVVELTPTEFALLVALAQKPGRILTRGQLLEAASGDDDEPFDRAIDAHIKNIRRKLEPDPRKPRYILTVYGVGYKFAEPS